MKEEKKQFSSLCAPLINPFECNSQSENKINNKINENKKHEIFSYFLFRPQEQKLCQQ